MVPFRLLMCRCFPAKEWWFVTVGTLPELHGSNAMNSWFSVRQLVVGQSSKVAAHISNCLGPVLGYCRSPICIRFIVTIHLFSTDISDKHLASTKPLYITMSNHILTAPKSHEFRPCLAPRGHHLKPPDLAVAPCRWIRGSTSSPSHAVGLCSPPHDTISTNGS